MVTSTEGADTSSSLPGEGLSGDTVLQSVVLEGLAEAVNYREWLASLALPWLGDEAIEIGSGTGDYAATWAQMGHRIVASEADAGRLALLRRRFDGDPQVAVRRLHAPVVEHAEYSAAVAYNVLEHIADDVAALRGFGHLVREGGHVILVVPAFPVAMSRFDREIGHFRRYRRAELGAALVAAGLEVVELRYVNPVGLLAWIAGMRLLRRRPTPGPSVRAYDRVVPLLRRWDERHRSPFGQSLFAVGRRAD